MTKYSASRPARSAAACWFRELLQGPGRPIGGYFDRLDHHIRASAPLERFDG